jgi:hypothetical protein
MEGKMETKEYNNLDSFEVDYYAFIEKKIWNPNVFIALSIIFSFLPAAILYSLNYGRLGYSKKRNIFLICSFAVFILIITLAIVIKPQIASIFTALNIGLGIYFMNSQKALYKKHLEQGGKKESFVLPMIFTLFFIGLIVFAMIYFSNIPDNMKSINGDELYYTDSISNEELDKLEHYLINNQVLVNDGNQISVKIDKHQDIYKLSFVIDKEYINDEEIMESFKSLAQGVSQNVYNYKKVVIQYCDDTFKVLKILD